VRSDRDKVDSLRFVGALTCLWIAFLVFAALVGLLNSEFGGSELALVGGVATGWITGHWGRSLDERSAANPVGPAALTVFTALLFLLGEAPPFDWPQLIGFRNDDYYGIPIFAVIVGLWGPLVIELMREKPVAEIADTDSPRDI